MEPVWRTIAERLLSHEAGGREHPVVLANAAEQVCRKLQGQLTVLIGPNGTRALLERGLRLARMEFPFLDGVAIGGREGDCLRGVQDTAQEQDPAQVSGGLAALLTHILDLLGGFIGHDLTLRLLRRGWPEAPLNGAGSEAGEEER